MKTIGQGRQSSPSRSAKSLIAHAFHHNAFIVVSNGHAARYGSVTSGWDHFAEWKRLEEADKGSVAAEVLLNGMLARSRLLDLLENFIVFDESRAGAVRKVVARNHQVMGVDRAVAAVVRQEELKSRFPPGERLRHRVVTIPLAEPGAVDAAALGDAANAPSLAVVHAAEAAAPGRPPREIAFIERVHPDLGRLGVVWHTQGSGKSYSMLFFAEKVPWKPSTRPRHRLAAPRRQGRHGEAAVRAGVAAEQGRQVR